MYLLDSNVFIEAKNSYYGFDFCPAFWDWLVKANAARRVWSIEKVRDELVDAQDDLSKWVQGISPGFFLKPVSQSFPNLAKVSNWANTRGFDAAAVSTFLATADYYLVAEALTYGFTVVTREKYDANCKKRIKIPNACKELGVSCITSHELLRREKPQFILGP
ncbi:protein of unknown function [Amycolatopsis lurida]|uniref:DUF4411 family protein n=1 Tax=Amycolatopsis lurida TaxID=31959 RepID=UPI000896061E|nr:DUF4411 family protein [Amycolatopsis lurida]SED39699.1 protein of unknown function [Amycolatopsis lurida]